MARTGLEDLSTAAIRGTTLAYRELGEGEPVVFVHGGVSDLRTWRQQLPILGRSYRAIAYSRRYARPNPPIDPDAANPMQVHVEDLAAFLREIAAAPAHLVGNSWGAMVCLLTAIEHPDVVRSLVLEEPPAMPLFFAHTPPRPAELLRLFATRPRTALAIGRFVLGTIAPTTKAHERGRDAEAVGIFLKGVLGEAHHARVSPESRQYALENAADSRALMLHPGFPPLDHDRIRELRVPVLLLTGEHSPAVLLRLTDRLAELLPNRERVEIPGASHLMHEDDPPAVNRAILGFLERQRGPER